MLGIPEQHICKFLKNKVRISWMKMQLHKDQSLKFLKNKVGSQVVVSTISPWGAKQKLQQTTFYSFTFIFRRK